MSAELLVTQCAREDVDLVNHRLHTLATYLVGVTARRVIATATKTSALAIAMRTLHTLNREETFS